MHFRSIIFIILTWLLPFSSVGQLKGFVFIDQNDNGKRDQDEKGLAGAVLSDGQNVVRSGSDGSFELKGWDKQRFVTLYQGGDFSCDNYFIPVNSNTTSYQFAVQMKHRKEFFRFVQISDTETYEFRDWVDHLKKYINVGSPAFLMHSGDLCYKSGIKWHAENITSESMRVPVYYCLGNHDLIAGDYGEQYFESLLGPSWYAFEEGNMLFVVTPMLRGDYKPGFTQEEIGTWLKNLLEVYGKSQPKIFFNHDLLTSSEKFEFKINDIETLVLNDYNVKAWAYGHHHKNMVKDHGNQGIISFGTNTVKGGINHSPSSYRVIDVKADGAVFSQLRWLNVQRKIQIVSPQKGQCIPNNNGEVTISVNIYDSSAEVDSVRFGIWGAEGFNWESSLDRSKWKKMNQNSDWNWSASFTPENEEMHEVVVNAFLKSGELLSAKEKFNVTNSGSDFADIHWGNLGGNMQHHPVVNQRHKLPYQLQWTSNIGSNIFMSSPVVHGNKLFTAGFDDGNARNCYIVSLNASTGEEIWKVKTVNGVKNQMVLADDLLIASDMQGITYAINTNSGKLEWKKEPPAHDVMGFVKGLVTDGKVVYTGSGRNLCALDVSDGRIIWQNNEWSGGDGTTTTMTIAGDVLIASSQWGAIHAHNRFSGELIWSRSDDGLRFRDGVLSFADGYLWVAQNEKFYQLNLNTGETIQSFPTGMRNTGTSAPIVLKDRIIVAGSHPGIAAFNRLTAEKIWEFQVDPALIYTPSYFCDKQQSIETTPVLVGNKIIFGAMDGNLYVLDSNTGRLLWKTTIGAPVLTSIVPLKNGFFVCDFAGNIYRYKSQLTEF
jgi:outer membrane protein assembly factor BamB